MEIQTLKRRLSPKQQQRRNLIIARARELLSAQGAAISMEAVAEASQTSRSTLYRYFSSREHLISEVTLDAGYRLIDFLERQPPTGITVGERVSYRCREISQLAEANAILLAACVGNIASEDPAVIDAQKEVEQLVSGMFRSIVGQAQLASGAEVEKSIFRYLLGSFLLATTGKLNFGEITLDLTEFCHSMMGDIWDTPCS